MLNGNLLRVSLGSEEIASTTSVSLDYTYDTIEVTTTATEGWREVINNNRSFTVSFDGLGWAGNDIFEHEGTRVGFIFHIDRFTYVGSGILTSTSKSGGVDDVPTFSGAIEGTGELVEEIPTRNEGICHDALTICFDGDQLTGPVIDL